MNPDGNTADNEAPLVLPTESSQDPNQTFTLFPDLPGELQIMIWKFATLLTEPRTFRVTTRRGSEGKDRDWLLYPYRRHAHPSYNEVPILFHTTREARATALMSYQLSFSNEFAGKPVYFNFKRDTFLFESLTSMFIFAGMGQLDEEIIKYPKTEERLLNALPNEPSRL